MTPMQLIEHLSSDEISKLIDGAQADNDDLRRQLTEAQTYIDVLKKANAILSDENKQLKLEMEAVGAGGVSLMGSRA